MSMTFDNIRELYLRATGENSIADRDWSLHLTEGYRAVARELDVPELREPEAYYALAIDEHYFTVDCDVYAIANLHNVTDGIPMKPEPGGMAGRDRFLEPTEDAVSDPAPPQGTVTHWVRTGNRIYVRDRPSYAVRIAIRFHVQVPVITEANLENHPLTPQEYDQAIALAAAQSFFRFNPKENMGDGGRAPLSDFFGREAMMVTRPKNPTALEDRGQHQAIRLVSFRPAPRSRY